MSRGRRLFWTLLAAGIAFVPGCIVRGLVVGGIDPQGPVESVPMPKKSRQPPGQKGEKKVGLVKWIQRAILI